MFAVKSEVAFAYVLVDAINALSSVLARLFSAIIDVDFAITSFESASAFAGVIVDAIDTS
jgi:hypothetical protein